MENYGTKELYDLRLKATYPLEIGDRHFETGETIIRFDNIQLLNFEEIKSRAHARGGINNKVRVTWEKTQEVTLSFNQGVFSKTQFAMLGNSHILKTLPNTSQRIGYSEILETDEFGSAHLKYLPINLFVYDEQTGERISNYTLEQQQLVLQTPYQSILVDYDFDYREGATTFQLGENLINGFCSLEAKMRLKDDQTGQNITGIIKMPKVKLMSDLSMQLGREASPMVAQFYMVAYPSEISGEINICEITHLNSDIDA